VHRKLVFHRELLEGMRARWSARGLDMPPLNERQAYLPSGAVALPNAVGSAPGFRMAVRSKDVFVVPGVPAEMRAMLETSVLPDLRSRSGGWVRRYRTLHTAGWPESRIAEVLTSRLGVPESRTLAYLPYWGGVDLRVGASGPPEEVNRKLGRLSGRIRRILGPVVFGTDGETLSGVIGRMLREKKATVAVAESCTGGLISSLLTDVAGSSRYFERAVVAYSNRSKVTLLGVRPSTLRAKGAVSVEAAAEMAAGVRRLAGTKYGLSATGIAGPAGATRGKPVGLVYVGLASGRRAVAYEFRFPGGRERVKILTATTALNLLRLHLLSGTLDHLGS
jgi:nicotinamide-nucleotide amidase